MFPAVTKKHCLDDTTMSDSEDDNVAVTPSKKGRGRPPSKSPGPAKRVREDSRSESSSEDAADASVAKKRGRPPANGVSAVPRKVKEVVKRGRGRPKKDSKGRGRPPKNGVAAVPREPYVPTGKPRGRKKKEGPVVPAYVPTGKSRGRPSKKKVDASDTE